MSKNNYTQQLLSNRVLVPVNEQFDFQAIVLTCPAIKKSVLPDELKHQLSWHGGALRLSRLSQLSDRIGFEHALNELGFALKKVDASIVIAQFHTNCLWVCENGHSFLEVMRGIVQAVEKIREMGYECSKKLDVISIFFDGGQPYLLDIEKLLEARLLAIGVNA